MGMKNLKKVVWGVCCTLFSSGLMAQTPPVLTLSLEKALEIALSENPTIRVADKEIERKDYSRKEAIGALLPVIEASGQYSRTLQKQVMYMDMDVDTETGSDSESGDQEGDAGGLGGIDMSKGMKVGRDNNWNGGFSMSLPIIAPALWKNIQLTQIDIEQTLESARASRISLVNQVEKAYYNILNAEDSYNVLLMSYDNAKLNAQNYSDKFKQGLVSEYDVLRSEVQVRNLEPGLLQAENGVRLAKLQLAVLLGLDVNIGIETETKLADYEESLYRDALDLDTSLQHNTDLKQMEIQERLLEKTLQVQQMSYYPTLSATANYTWMSMNDDFKFSQYRWTPYSSVGIALSIPLFQGGTRYFKEQQAKIGIEQLKYQRDDLERNLRMQVQAAQDNIAQSVKQVSSNKEGVRQAEKAYEIMQKSFEIGSATFVELNDADLALTNSRLAYNQAIYDYLTAKVELNMILGKNVVEIDNNKQ